MRNEGFHHQNGQYPACAKAVVSAAVAGDPREPETEVLDMKGWAKRCVMVWRLRQALAMDRRNYR